ncbi:proline-rich protein 2-like [Eublepharis macularius]|uniref:Proline-rich protein 2-like n=1 Tax=Eublepharis macularius TaxID=481883 RepID=A0AA97KSW0_EUBMA|nr:proline-rich protein 2-like [Eublepharis macularius]
MGGPPGRHPSGPPWLWPARTFAAGPRVLPRWQRGRAARPPPKRAGVAVASPRLHFRPRGPSSVAARGGLPSRWLGGPARLRLACAPGSGPGGLPRQRCRQAARPLPEHAAAAVAGPRLCPRGPFRGDGVGRRPGCHPSGQPWLRVAHAFVLQGPFLVGSTGGRPGRHPSRLPRPRAAHTFAAGPGIPLRWRRGGGLPGRRWGGPAQRCPARNGAQTPWGAFPVVAAWGGCPGAAQWLPEWACEATASPQRDPGFPGRRHGIGHGPRPGPAAAR